MEKEHVNPNVEAEAAATEQPAAEVQEEEPTLEQVQADLERMREQLLRTAADFQNFRRRTERELTRAAQATKKRVLGPVLEVYDDVARALESARTQDLPEACAGLFQGFELVYQKFSVALQQLGVEPIDVQGVPFDEHLHEAVMRQPAPEGVAPGTILSEVQRGYLLDGEVLRHARVVVAA
ncbi:nucleotide exchange factor GrpE [Rhodocaloribacter litoris]|uniref:nucleotide exchange factor GrpE n=1 Tax=Rhodocaloribacter litoris TaxID=2558931 RepID=UPI001420E28C|nr:nucleotide exchange factor GrpE [Rhodocaloribacter litoris]QXD13762.1 nucleotide exchange factor GrpE [Rhodocaloribacter litoris]